MLSHYLEIFGITDSISNYYQNISLRGYRQDFSKPNLQIKLLEGPPFCCLSGQSESNLQVATITSSSIPLRHRHTGTQHAGLHHAKQERTYQNRAARMENIFDNGMKVPQVRARH